MEAVTEELMSRTRVRPIGQAITYTIPGHVIGGSEPKASKQAEQTARVAQNRKSKKPRATGRTVVACFDSECYWCGRRVAKGELIAPVKVSPGTRWIHRGCAA
jgi:hypothetical protein